jgi:ribosomal protein S18 acetylase RimI-like enzyme
MIVTSTSPSIRSSGHIRRLDVARDLNPVADLIELCFPIHRDQDGQTYLRQMRKAARDIQFLKGASSLSEFSSQSAAGFVWEEDHKIVGNLSLIRFQEGGQTIHLIANVAVHPDYRRRGIGKALTTRAIEYLRRRGEPRTWLQVRDDNAAAYSLYYSLGFEPRFSRMTWRGRPSDMNLALEEKTLIQRRRNMADWPHQRHWLRLAYPTHLRWNLPVDFKRFEPDPVVWIGNLLDGSHHRHWAFERNGKLTGIVSWQKTTSYANNLWLAFPVETEPVDLLEALQRSIKQLSGRHPVSIDYDQGRSEEIFRQLGFHHFRTLVWMSCSLK